MSLRMPQSDLARLMAQRLENAMWAASLTQAELAKKSGAPASVICRALSGENVPTSGMLRALALALNVSADYLLGLTSEADARGEEQALKARARAHMLRKKE